MMRIGVHRETLKKRYMDLAALESEDYVATASPHCPQKAGIGADSYEQFYGHMKLAWLSIRADSFNSKSIWAVLVSYSANSSDTSKCTDRCPSLVEVLLVSQYLQRWDNNKLNNNKAQN